MIDKDHRAVLRIKQVARPCVAVLHFYFSLFLFQVGPRLVHDLANFPATVGSYAPAQLQRVQSRFHSYLSCLLIFNWLPYRHFLKFCNRWQKNEGGVREDRAHRQESMPCGLLRRPTITAARMKQVAKLDSGSVRGTSPKDARKCVAHIPGGSNPENRDSEP